MIENCESYSLNEDKCIDCGDSYYINSLGNECILNPFGIKNCLEYTNATTCKTCAVNYYLNNNTCLFIEED